MNQVQLACPFCARPFRVEARWQGIEVVCPHCDRAVSVPALDDASSPYTVRDHDRLVVDSEGNRVAIRRLSPEERQRFRRRLNMLFAIVGVVVLMIVLAILLQLS